MAAAYVKERDIPYANPVPEDPLPHKLGVPAADIMHALFPLNGRELPPHQDRTAVLKVVIGRDEPNPCFTLAVSLQVRVHG